MLFLFHNVSGDGFRNWLEDNLSTKKGCQSIKSIDSVGHFAPLAVKPSTNYRRMRLKSRPGPATAATSWWD